MRPPDAPRVVVLLVATDGSRWLEGCLDGLRSQDHRPLDAIAVDNASSDDSPSMLMRAFGPSRVVRLERRVGYGRALAAGLKVAAERGLEADAYLLVHDDAVLAPGALTEMLRILAEPDIGIVGCKVLDWDHPEVLQDVGLTTDRYGRMVPRVEKGEIDQGQHDGVRVVQAVQSAAMLVSREVVETLGLFDLRYEMLRDDIDLCWRARLAGAKTAITTHATVRHAAASSRGLRDSPAKRSQRFLADRNMLATLIKCYGPARLALALPVTLAVSLVNTVLFFATGRRTASLQVLRALWWNLQHLPSTLAARRRVQKARRVPDSQATTEMHHGATRFRRQVSHVLDALAGDAGGSDDDPDAPRKRLTDRIRAHPVAATAFAAAFAVLLAMRPLLFEGPVAGADMPPFPESGGDLISAFVSGWRGPDAGGSGPATPGLFLVGILSYLFAGSTWLASRVLLAGLPVVAALGAARLAMSLGLGTWEARGAGLLYGLSPVVLGAASAGRLHDLAVAAGMPMLVILLARATGAATPAAPFAAIAVVVAAGSLGPWLLAAVLPLGLIAALFSRSRAPLAASARLAVLAAALLFPWTFELLRPDSPVMAGGAEPRRTMLDLLAFAPGAARPIPMVLSYGLVVVALAGFALAPRARRRTASAGGLMAMTGLAAAWAVERNVPLAPRSALPLMLSALGASILAAIAVGSLPARLAERTVGLRHAAAFVAGVALLAQAGAGLAWLAAGERVGVHDGRALLPPSFSSEVARIGSFRVLWLDGTREDARYSLTGPAGASMTGYLARHDGAGADALHRTVTAIAGGGTTSGGRLLATFGVAFVVLRPGTGPDLTEAFAGQVDLGFVQQVRGAQVLGNEAAVPPAAGVSARGWAQAAAGTIDGVAGAESQPQAGKAFKPVGEARLRGSAGKARTVLLAEDFSWKWRMHVAGTTLEPRRSFGWATRFVLPAGSTGPATIRWAGQTRHRLLLSLEAIFALLFVGAWYQSRVRGVSS